MKVYLDKKLRDLDDSIKRNLSSEKKSLQYDLKKNFDELKNTLLANNLSGTLRLTLSDAKTKLDVKLPFTDLEDFKKFDDDVKSSNSKKEALVKFTFNSITIYTILISHKFTYIYIFFSDGTSSCFNLWTDYC